MKRSLRLVQWHGVLIGVLLGWPTLVSAQNIYPNSGPVGIGTTNPNRTLHLSVSGQPTVALSDTRAATNNKEMGFVYDGGIALSSPGIVWQNLNDSGGFLANLATFFKDGSVIFGGSGITHPAVAGQAVFMGGNVGIGTTSPAAKLHVAGDAQVDGNLAAKYQDVAEWVQASSFLPSGVVVVVDTRSRNRVLEASEPYDTRVAGVVSARPGLLLGEGGESKVKVAHSGRVKVKVDSSYGPIAVGDLLVTSPTPGHAMRSQPLELGGTSIHRPGTLLGKALEPLEAGQGEILVLLTLQ